MRLVTCVPVTKPSLAVTAMGLLQSDAPDYATDGSDMRFAGVSGEADLSKLDTWRSSFIW